MSLSIDIVIPTYKRPDALSSLLPALLTQCRATDSIIVVHQGQGRPLYAPSPKVRVICRTRPNLPAARNAGIDASSADVILFLDDDCEPLPGLVDAHRFSYADNRMAGTAGFVDDPQFDRTRQYPSFIDLSTGECVQNFSLARSGPTISAMGANMSFRRAELVAIGGFDPCYKANALWEDVDLCLRLLATGKSLRYCAEARVLHHRRNTGGCRAQTGLGYLYHLFANTAYFACRFAERRHYGSWVRFWKYRLEYLSRVPQPSPLRHNPIAVATGMAGAAGGALRYVLSCLIYGAARWRIDHTALRHAFAEARMP